MNKNLSYVVESVSKYFEVKRMGADSDIINVYTDMIEVSVVQKGEIFDIRIISLDGNFKHTITTYDITEIEKHIKSIAIGLQDNMEETMEDMKEMYEMNKDDIIDEHQDIVRDNLGLPTTYWNM